MDRELNPYSLPFFEAIATEGVGVQETLEGIVKLVMRSLRERYEPVVAAGVTETPAPRLDHEAPAAAWAPSHPKPPPPVSPVTPPPATTAPPGPTPAAPPESVAPSKGSDLFQFASSPDEITTGVYAMGPNTGVPEDEANKTTVGRSGGFISSAMAAAGRPGQSSLPDEPTRVRQQPLQPSPLDPPIARPPEPEPPPSVADIPDFEPQADEPSQFVDEPTDVDLSAASFDAVADDEFAFGGDAAAPEAGPAPPDLEPLDDSGRETPEGVPSGDEPVFPSGGPEGRQAPGFGADAPAGATPPVSRAARASVVGSVDALMESVLGRKVPDARRPATDSSAGLDSSLTKEPAESVLPEPADAEPVVSRLATPKPATPTFAGPRAAARSWPAEGPFVDEPSDRIPVTIGKGDPFAMAEPEVKPTAVPVLARAEQPGAGIVRVGDNQLHLRLQGTGAIAESGQVRALDIEVPVPGSWVGNRRVTLQLRLTLTPASEDEDGGPGSTS